MSFNYSHGLPHITRMLDFIQQVRFKAGWVYGIYELILWAFSEKKSLSTLIVWFFFITYTFNKY